MGIPFYLAMTGAEFPSYEPGSFPVAYMACHFSLYDTGLANLPDRLPPGAMVIINDQIPAAGHSADAVVRQLQRLCSTLRPECLLLDFQRPGCEETKQIAGRIAGSLPIPVGAAPEYAADGCPLFLPPIPPEVSAETYLLPYAGRELWLEAALQCREIQVTTQGAHFEPLCPWREAEGIRAEHLCAYTICREEDGFCFRLFDTRQSLLHKLEDAASFGVTKAVGLYQEIQKPLC